jgi:hypothetical protein
VAEAADTPGVASSSESSGENDAGAELGDSHDADVELGDSREAGAELGDSLDAGAQLGNLCDVAELGGSRGPGAPLGDSRDTSIQLGDSHEVDVQLGGSLDVAELGGSRISGAPLGDSRAASVQLSDSHDAGAQLGDSLDIAEVVGSRGSGAPLGDSHDTGDTGVLLSGPHDAGAQLGDSRDTGMQLSDSHDAGAQVGDLVAQVGDLVAQVSDSHGAGVQLCNSRDAAVPVGFDASSATSPSIGTGVVVEQGKQWVLVWKHSLGEYGRYVKSISSFGWGVFLKLEQVPPGLAQAEGASKYLIFNVETAELHSLACDGTHFPLCHDLHVLPDRSVLFLSGSGPDGTGVPARVLFVEEGFSRLDQRFVLPRATPMHAATCDDLSPETCMIVQAYTRELLVLSWQCRGGGKDLDRAVLHSFTLSRFAPSETASSELHYSPYTQRFSSRVTQLTRLPIVNLASVPELTKVLSAVLGPDDALHLLCVERAASSKHMQQHVQLSSSPPPQGQLNLHLQQRHKIETKRVVFTIKPGWRADGRPST